MYKKLIPIMTIFLITGCSSLYTPIRTDDALSGMNLLLKEDSEKLKTSANIIDSTSKEVKVKQEATKVIMVANGLADKDIIAKKMKAYTEDLESKVEKLMNDKTKRVENFFYWGIIVGSVIFAGGIAFIIVCYAAGVPNLAGLALQLTLFGASIALFSGAAYYYFWMAITGIAIIVGVFIILLIVKAIKDNKSLLEVVQTSEVYKNVKDTAQANTLAKVIQSNETRKLVSTIRSKNGLKGLVTLDANIPEVETDSTTTSKEDI
ncbi:MAG: hypothetical protein M0P71_01145 [Melioribacteraceae bacterium]|nr:hypothetical protein [Melioribacteraceae bacterium]